MMRVLSGSQTGRRRWGIVPLLLVALLALSVLTLPTLTGCGSRKGKQEATRKAAQYHCPMHPTIISDKPGDCPICGMRLVPIDEERTDSPAADTANGKSGSDEGSAGGEVPGMAPVKLTEEGMKLAGVRTAPATRETLDQTIRTVGLVTADEGRIQHVQVKTGGWVEKLNIAATGQAVKKGTPVLSLYSPELIAGQEEFLRARQAESQLGATADPEARRRVQGLVQSARQRLLFFDVPESFIRDLEASGEASRAVPLLSPVSGYVTAKEAFVGQKVDPGVELFTVTDLSRVWIEGEIYEYEASRVRLGQLARLTLGYDPSVQLEGAVKLIEPTLDPETRTLKVRFEFENPDLALKPGMFVTVELSPGALGGIYVPDDAVMDTGKRQIVFVQESPGNFTPRAVRVGLRTGEKTEILSGLEEGENVAVRANFLLDSESKIRAAIGGSGVAPSGPAGQSPPAGGGEKQDQGKSMPPMPGM